MCDCAEELARRKALERQRQLDGSAEAGSRGDSSSDGGISWYSVLGGTLLMALFAFAAKTGADQDGWAKPIYIWLGLYVEEDKGPCGTRIDKGKRRWPLDDKEQK